MALIKSISGIRGTIGGKTAENLTPLDIVKFSAAFGRWIIHLQEGNKVIVGRDARISGEMISQLVINTLIAMGIDVIDASLSTTPTIEMAVVLEKADGGIIITASHNPANWNALKLLNNKGEFISAEDGLIILETAQKEDFLFANVFKLGCIKYPITDYISHHINQILNLNLINKKAIETRNFTIVVDAINSTGAISVPPLLRALGIKNIIVINEEVTGHFTHEPEPLPENLSQLREAVLEYQADLGIAVDPDVDRLCFVNEDGNLFGEEYTLVAVADYILRKNKGNTVSNLSSTNALKETTIKYGGEYFSSKVGEVNVVKKMKECSAIIGGEGNGGVIVPQLHYGRDALAGIAIFLSALAEFGGKISSYRNNFPFYGMIKKKIELIPEINTDNLLVNIINENRQYNINTEDGVKIEYEDGWVHLRGSNTEPILRIYAESTSIQKANEKAENIIENILRQIK